ncbi:MAG: hypothetical protein OXM01_03040 [Gemmatimonadota bacterium]|nr:hypothetical protein [Gemmatimonadota bacterium]
MIALAIALLLSTAGLTLADQGDAALRRIIYATLQEQLAQQASYSQDLLNRIAQGSGVPVAELRPRLQGMLDSLMAQREAETDAWEMLLLQGGPDIAPERAGKLIAYLAKESRSVLANENNILLEKRIKKVARKAKVPFFQSRDYILRTLAWAVDSSAPQKREKQSLHFLVVGHTNPFEVALDPLFLFFDTEDEAFVREQVREVQRFLVPALVRRLPELDAIGWAVRERESNALVIPDYQLRIGINEFRFVGSNLDLKPCIETTLEVTQWESQVRLMEESFSFCSEQHGSATSHELAPFWDEAADAIGVHVVERLGR